MKMYYSRETAPLKWNSYTKWMRMPFAVIGVMVEVVSTINLYKEAPSFWLAIIIAYSAALVALGIMCIIGLFKWESYAWYGIMIFEGLSIFMEGVLMILSICSGEYVGTLIIYPVMSGCVSILISALIIVYYYKRKPLFINYQGNVLEQDLLGEE